MLPDRECRHRLQFYVLPSMVYPARLAVAGTLILFGLAIQLLWPWTEPMTVLLVTAPMLVAGNLLLLVRGYSLAPASRSRSGDWEKTTRDRFHQVLELERKIRRWDETFVDVTCMTGAISLALLTGAMLLLVWLLNLFDTTRPWATVFVVDAAVLLLPHWITGTRRAWRPVALRQQIESLEIALKVIEHYSVPPCQIQPMFELVGSDEKRTPIAARVFIRFPEGPEDFLGLQLQVSVNEVQGTHYPYLYAVLIARPNFGMLDDHLENIRRIGKTLTVESKRDADVHVIVLRQRTTKNSGYHTDAAAVRKIANVAWNGVSYLLAGVATP